MLRFSLILFLTLLVIRTCDRVKERAGHPNIIIILADDLQDVIIERTFCLT